MESLSASPIHHTMIAQLETGIVSVPFGYHSDYLGILTKNEYQLLGQKRSNQFRSILKRGPGATLVDPGIPAFNEEYFEWIDLLETVKLAKGKYVFFDLGSGYGRWLARAAKLCQMLGVTCHLTGVEGEPTHYRWMIDHLSYNGFNPKEHRLINAAVSGENGDTMFYVGKPSDWYGQRIATKEESRNYSSIFSRDKMRRVQKIAITELLKDCVADFIDMDVQGSELEIIVAARELLGARVKRVHIGTHSEKVENGLRALFTELTWTNLHDYSLQGKRETPYGMIDFGDGVQTWVNPIFVT